MSDDAEPALDIGFPDLDVEFVTEESEERARRVRVVDTSLRPSKANIAAFWSKVVKSPTCWYWVGAISAPDGYGRFNFQRENRQRTMLAHRFSVELVHGPLAPDVVCEHSATSRCVCGSGRSIWWSPRTARMCATQLPSAGCPGTHPSTGKAAHATSDLSPSVRRCAMATTRTRCSTRKPTPGTGKEHCSDRSNQSSVRMTLRAPAA